MVTAGRCSGSNPAGHRPCLLRAEERAAGGESACRKKKAHCRSNTPSLGLPDREFAPQRSAKLVQLPHGAATDEINNREQHHRTEE